MRAEFTSLAISSAGRIAAGTVSGPVFSGELVSGIGRSTAVEFYDDFRVLAATFNSLMN